MELSGVAIWEPAHAIPLRRSGQSAAPMLVIGEVPSSLVPAGGEREGLSHLGAPPGQGSVAGKGPREKEARTQERLNVPEVASGMQTAHLKVAMLKRKRGQRSTVQG